MHENDTLVEVERIVRHSPDSVNSSILEFDPRAADETKSNKYSQLPDRLGSSILARTARRRHPRLLITG